ncbi:TPA: sulfite exporter TauE/SafE family protein [Klebsiella pneumoniae]|nr:sulfite exporter TauE/SafE family protein [Klebsiella pneumoniae]
MFDLHTISFLLIFIAAGLVKGVTGMGLPTVAMGLLGLLMPPQAAAALLVLPSLLTNLWQLLAGPALAQIVRRLWLMMTGIIIGTLAGSSLLIGLNPRWSALGFRRDELVQALGLSFTLSTLALAAGLALHDGWHDDAWLLSALALLPALLGMWLGQRIRSRLSPQRFRQGFLLFLLALGIELIARGWLV